MQNQLNELNELLAEENENKIRLENELIEMKNNNDELNKNFEEK